MKKFILFLIILVAVVFTGQYLQKFAEEKKEDLGVSSIPQEQKEPDYATEQITAEPKHLTTPPQTDTYAEYRSTSSAESPAEATPAAPDNPGFGDEITAAILEAGSKELSLEELEKLLARLQIPSEKSEQGAASVGLRKVITASDKIRGLQFFEASFNEFEDGRQELGFLRYVLDPNSHDSQSLAASISSQVGRNPVDPDANPKVWRLDEHTNMILMDDFKGNTADEQGYLISIEEEIH